MFSEPTYDQPGLAVRRGVRVDRNVRPHRPRLGISSLQYRVPRVCADCGEIRSGAAGDRALGVAVSSATPITITARNRSSGGRPWLPTWSALACCPSSQKVCRSKRSSWLQRQMRPARRTMDCTSPGATADKHGSFAPRCLTSRSRSSCQLPTVRPDGNQLLLLCGGRLVASTINRRGRHSGADSSHWHCALSAVAPQASATERLPRPCSVSTASRPAHPGNPAISEAEPCALPLQGAPIVTAIT